MGTNKIIDETAEWEPLGPTPLPKLTDLREWDMKLLSRYRPQFHPVCDKCCFCAFGVCDLSGGKRGACGLDLNTQESRKNFLRACMGLSSHTAHARDMVNDTIDLFGPNVPLDMGPQIDCEAPNIRLVCGMKPETLGDLPKVCDYVEEELTQMLDSVHTGQEGNYLDYESKALHAGMLDLVAMETADIAQIAAYGMPKGDPEAPLADVGMGTMDREKPVVLVYGHNVVGAADILNYVEENDLFDDVEICGLCCTILDLTRIDARPKIVGSLASALKFIKSGVADVIVTDEQCVRTDTPEEAFKVGSRVIATSTKICYGFPDRTEDPVDEIVEDMIEGRQEGVLILDLEKVGEVAVKAAMGIAEDRERAKGIPSEEELKEMVDECVQCRGCERNCPNNYPIPEAMASAQDGDYSKLAEIYSEYCIGCGRCEHTCPKDIEVVRVMSKAAEKRTKEEEYKCRVGIGPLRDTVIKEVGAPITTGEIPGVIALVGCSNYPGSKKPISDLVFEFARRNYIIALTGCHAIDASFYTNDEGKTVYESETGVVVNCGSCVSNSHISGAALKAVNILAKLGLRANYQEVADYILNRVGACGISWGAMSQKAVAIANGFQRLGVPVICGPRSAAYGRSQMGRQDREEDWIARNKMKPDEEGLAEPAPRHLIYYAETPEEVMVKASELTIRPADTSTARQRKLQNYIDIYRDKFGEYPPNIFRYVRREEDLPPKYRREIMEILEKDPRWKKGKFGVEQPTLLKPDEIEEAVGGVD